MLGGVAARVPVKPGAQPFTDLSSYIMSAPLSDLFFQPKLDQEEGSSDTERRKHQLDKISHTLRGMIMPNDIQLCTLLQRQTVLIRQRMCTSTFFILLGIYDVGRNINVGQVNNLTSSSPV